MAHSVKAWMKAVREICGITQADLAAEADVQIRTVKRWEHPDWPEPPEDVIMFLKAALHDHDEAVSELVGSVIANASTEDGILLDWYRNQEQRDIEGGADVPYTYSNAITRSAAERLGTLGYKVMFKYPNQEMLAEEVS